MGLPWFENSATFSGLQHVRGKGSPRNLICRVKLASAQPACLYRLLIATWISGISTLRAVVSLPNGPLVGSQACWSYTPPPVLDALIVMVMKWTHTLKVWVERRQSPGMAIALLVEKVSGNWIPSSRHRMHGPGFEGIWRNWNGITTHAVFASGCTDLETRIYMPLSCWDHISLPISSVLLQS